MQSEEWKDANMPLFTLHFEFTTLHFCNGDHDVTAASRPVTAFVPVQIRLVTPIPHGIPLAEQRRRRSAEPQRLVQLQHGIPISPNQPEDHESPITVTAIVRRRGLMSHSR